MGYGAYGEPVVSSHRRFKVHPEDVDTLAHWPLQGDQLDSVGPNDISGNLFYQSVNGLDAGSTVQAYSVRSNINVAAPSAGIKLVPAFTIACWASINQDPSGNLAIVGMRGPGPNAPYNFPWELGYEVGVGVRFFWQGGTKSYEGTISQPINFGEWYHLIGTRNAGQDTARLYINGVLADEATGLNPLNDGSNQNSVEFFNNSLSATLNGQLFSVIIKDVYTDTGAAVALYESTIETAGA